MQRIRRMNFEVKKTNAEQIAKWFRGIESLPVFDDERVPTGVERRGP